MLKFFKSSKHKILKIPNPQIFKSSKSPNSQNPQITNSSKQNHQILKSPNPEIFKIPKPANPKNPENRQIIKSLGSPKPSNAHFFKSHSSKSLNPKALKIRKSNLQILKTPNPQNP